MHKALTERKKTSRQTKGIKTNKTIIESNRVSHFNKKDQLNKNCSIISLFAQHNYTSKKKL